MIKHALLIICICVSLSRENKLTGRIIGGEVARAGQFPFAAAVYINHPGGSYFCGGTLINDQWILTSGQCAALSISFIIRLGTTTLDGGTLVAADHFQLAPGWNSENFQNDVGLIRLRAPITFTDYIQPIEFISDVELPDYTDTVTFGWGQISDSQAGVVNDLRYVNLVTLSQEECERIFGLQITDSMVCAVGEYNEGTCRGDLGSPLIRYGSDGAYVVAVSSFISTKGCESTDPSGFIRINPYREWIRNITGT